MAPKLTSSRTGTFYFAYGSNLSTEQLFDRCQEARPTSSQPVAIVRLDNWKWIINARGYANIVPINSTNDQQAKSSSRKARSRFASQSRSRSRNALRNSLNPNKGPEKITLLPAIVSNRQPSPDPSHFSANPLPKSRSSSNVRKSSLGPGSRHSSIERSPSMPPVPPLDDHDNNTNPTTGCRQHPPSHRTVYGILYNLTTEAESRLDMFEGYGQSRFPPHQNPDHTTQRTKSYLQSPGWAYNKLYLTVSVIKWLQPSEAYLAPYPSLALAVDAARDTQQGAAEEEIIVMTYVDELRTQPGKPNEEYVIRMQEACRNALRLGVPREWMEDVMTLDTMGAKWWMSMDRNWGYRAEDREGESWEGRGRRRG